MADNPLDLLLQNIARTESGGWRDPYAATGPDTGEGNRALGKYQVMASNVPQWTQDVLGQAMSPLQFLNSPAAQEAVAKAKLAAYMSQYGPAGAANMWFTGKARPDPNTSDILGTSAGKYAKLATAGMDMATAPQAPGPIDPSIIARGGTSPQIPDTPGTTLTSIPAPPSTLDRIGGLANNKNFLANVNKATGQGDQTKEEGGGGMKESPFIPAPPARNVSPLLAAGVPQQISMALGAQPPAIYGTSLAGLNAPQQWSADPPGVNPWQNIGAPSLGNSPMTQQQLQALYASLYQNPSAGGPYG